MEISGKVAVVTGAGSGIGRASAVALADAGAAIIVADIDSEGGKETVELIEGEGRGAAAFVAADVTEPGEVAAAYVAAEERFGGLDIVHNNAGIVCGEPVWPETDPDRLLQQVMVNLGAVVVGTRLAIEPLSRRGGGAIVNTASLASLLPMHDEPAYSATKAGVLMFTRACAPLALTHNIRVTAVAPPLVDTPLLPKSGDGTRPAAWAELARQLMPLLRPEDVAEVVVDLIRDDLAGDYRFVGDMPEFLAELVAAPNPPATAR